MTLTPREEILIELFRTLAQEQRAELIKNMRALVDANRIVQKELKEPIRVIGNVRIEAKYGLPTPRAAKRRPPRGSNRPKPRRPDRNQDDNE